MSNLLSPENIAIYMIISVLAAAFMLLAAQKTFAALQQLGYDNKKLFKWFKKPNNMLLSRLVLLSFLIFLSFSVINFSLSFLGKTAASYAGFSAFALFFSVFIYADRKYALKLPLKNTPRVKRLKTTYFILVFLFCAIFTVLLSAAVPADNEVLYIMRYIPLFSILPMTIVFFTAAAAAMNSVYENKKNRGYIKSAAQKIKDSDIKVVAVTGSFGKTSVKNILKTLMSEKYRVLASEGSFNTPLGVALTVNSAQLEEYDYLILEMGARKKGDIKELCEIAPPDIAVITGVCEQHLETFLTLDNIKDAKYEIVEHSKNSAVAVFGQSAADLAKRFEGKKICAGKDITTSDEKISADGCGFLLEYKKQNARINTVLLGKHNIENITVAAGAALAAGLSLEEIAAASQKITYQKHRLELKRAPNGINILDDSYNANIKGAEAALSVLKLMSGKKAVITPGIVELGILEEAENFALGEKMAFCDLVVLVGETLVKNIADGLLSKGFDQSKLFIVPALDAVGDILVKHMVRGDTVLFLNDLPDVYN